MLAPMQGPLPGFGAVQERLGMKSRPRGMGRGFRGPRIEQITTSDLWGWREGVGGASVINVRLERAGTRACRRFLTSAPWILTVQCSWDACSGSSRHCSDWVSSSS
eukprot:9500314-Pyramimonas_sp.AAC.1